MSELCDYLSHEYRKVYCNDYLMHRTNNQSSLLHHATQQPDPEVFEFYMENILQREEFQAQFPETSSWSTPGNLV
ncbi:hypothetical protein [Endozoicomonas sp. YOMI1]|uniref:hypothetical protein n=1 Tax=Endozoicomonas sp. YOMI1 TaxID=2828739 RepID=UPI0021477217|nr:hypothetical protein [Endozoicomonas sp. YOMI1]